MDRKRQGSDTSSRDPVARAEQTTEAREASLEEREHAADVREQVADARELAAGSRETELNDREAAGRLRDEATRARPEDEEISAKRELLLAQMKEANQRLVLATVRADEQAETAAYNEERFRSLVATSAALVWYADARGCVDVDEDSWTSLTGVVTTTGEPMWRWLESVHADDRDRAREAWSRALDEKTSYMCAHRLRAGDNFIWVVSRASPIRRAGTVREWIGMMTDITDSVRIDEAKEQFIAILGHDLRNPLSAILVGAETLAHFPDSSGKIAPRITRSAERMSALIRDMMDFTRGRLGGGIPVTRRPCDLRRICLDVVAEMKQAHPNRDLRCQIEGDLHAECDEDRLEQVLSNLLGNAISHGQDPITLSIQGHDEYEIMLVVENRGEPIPEAVMPSLFEPFLRGPRRDSSKDASEGLGLGLFIVREIVRAHGGTIAVSSTRVDGTRFTVRWPRTAAARVRSADPSA